MSNLQQQPEIENGLIYRLLTVIAQNTLISDTRLRHLMQHDFISDDLFEQTLAHILNLSLCHVLKPRAYKIVKAGRDWLDDHRDGLSVEVEDNSSEDVPKHPYDAAKLKMETKHLSIFQALRKIRKGEIDINPAFQRAFVWDQTKRSRLIESILIRIPLPAFYLDATSQTHWAVVDGLQRLSTLDAFCSKQDFVLSGLQFLTELEGMKFDDLPAHYKVLIEDDTSLLFYNLMPGTPIEAKFTIFSRVNTGGLQLTAQEIRHAMNQGKITETLAQLAADKTFSRVTGGVVESKRMSDRELILRALAFSQFGVSGYQAFGEQDGFLLHAMSELNCFDDEPLEKLTQRFLRSLKKVEVIFGDHAFRKFYEKGGRRGPLNKALFEVWTTCVKPYKRPILRQHKDAIIAAFLDLLNNDEQFMKSISAGTGSNKAVSTRFKKIKRLLKQVCQ